MEARLIASAIFLAILPSTDTLAFVRTNVVLPFPSSQHALVYDGEDSVYTIGGMNGHVAKYSIENDRSVTVGTFLNIGGGAAIMKGDEIFYFGGRVLDQVSGVSSNVYSYSTLTNKYTRVGLLPVAMEDFALAWDPVEEVVYLLGGKGADNQSLTNIYRYNVTTGECDYISYLPPDVAVYRSAGVWDSQRRAILSIGGAVASGPWQAALHHELDTGYLTISTEALHHEVGNPCAVISGAGDAIYVFGGLRGLIKFAPSILRSETIYLTGWPSLSIAPCVLVPKLRRVYIMGGFGSYFGEADSDRGEISYVDVTPWGVPALVTAATLPTGLLKSAAIYDGHDSIYIVGGDRQTHDQVLRFSIEAQTVEVDGEFVPIEDGAVILYDEEIIYFGGMTNDNELWTNGVYSYSTAHRTYSFITTMPANPVGRTSVAWDAEGQVAYVFGGYAPGASYPSIVRYDATTPDGNMTLADVGEHADEPVAVWDAQEHVVNFVVIGRPWGNEVLQFDPNEGTVSNLGVQLPHQVDSPCAVYADNVDGNAYIFLFGGVEEDGSMIKFDPTNNEANEVSVQGWPNVLLSASCAYVPKRGRVYIFGGHRDLTGEVSNEISYVQLKGPEPPTTSSTIDPAPSTSPEPVPTGADDPEDGASPALLYALIAGGVMAMIATVLVVVCAYRRRDKKKRPGAPNFGQRTGLAIIQVLTDAEENEFRQGKVAANQRPKASGDNDPEENLVIESLGYNPAFEVAKEDLIIDLTKKLGSGHYGVVYMGHVNQKSGKDAIPIAVKTVRSNAPVEYFKALMSELKILAHIEHHENIANLVGAYSGNIKNGELYVGVEFCKMSLLQHLKDQANGYIELMGSSPEAARGSGDRDEDQGPLATDLPRWAAEIAAGMEFLSQQRIVHGDLATRNVLLSLDRHAKICDFGLARQLVDYTYIKSHPDNLPWKWMAIESLTDMQFSTKSDVWAYGVTLWEIFSLGKPPFPWARWNVDFLKQLWAGHRLDKPDYANEATYNKMLECWSGKREDRPTFGDLKEFFRGETAKGASERSERIN